MKSLVKIMVLLLSAVVLFSCATKSFEKVEENIEEIKAEESAAPSDFGAMLLPLLSEEAEEKEEEELSLLFSDGDFIDIKNGEVYLEKVTEVKEETPELEVEEMEVTEGEEKKEINILSFALILGFVLISLILIVVLVRESGSRHKDEKKEEDESKDTEGISYLMELLKDEE